MDGNMYQHYNDVKYLYFVTLLFCSCTFLHRGYQMSVGLY